MQADKVGPKWVSRMHLDKYLWIRGQKAKARFSSVAIENSSQTTCESRPMGCLKLICRRLGNPEFLRSSRWPSWVLCVAVMPLAS